MENKSGKIKVLQYNIFFGRHPSLSLEERLQNVYIYILSVDADIVCLQEVLKAEYDTLINYLGKKYPYIFPDELSHNYDCVILSKFKILKSFSHEYDFTLMGRNLKGVLVEDHNKEKLYVVTSHYESEFQDNIVKKIFQYAKSSGLLLDLFSKENVPIILCCDSNCCKMAEHKFHTIFSYAKGWKDCWVETGSDPNKELTFNVDINAILVEKYKNNKQNFNSRLDRVLHLSSEDDPLTASGFRLIGENADVVLSDHYGILVEFERKINPDKYVPPFISAKVKVKPNKRAARIKKNYSGKYSKKMF